MAFLDHLLMWGALFGTGFGLGFLMTAIIIGAGKKRL